MYVSEILTAAQMLCEKLRLNRLAKGETGE